ncbi:nucleotidyltransferase domain-containing protein [Streptomyces sp. 1331.2]|uniref:nucleotidyltransferase domain-containing protein n=1 Tax=Streptomyces sp. 1331.2 TaxID=1938835 RepID=UPI000BC365EF|nr:nucleotidyltransferase [Streptomyces sp. 1331.2]SOB89015.1 hypothetical protein SAMN06272789_7344 [Streptomyces sp. 1331.2]
MPKSLAVAIDEFLTKMTPSASQFSASSRHRAEVEGCINAAIGLNRSVETGSLRHGTGVSGYSDADYLVSLKGDMPSSPEAILAKIRDALASRFWATRIRVSRPAVVCAFANGTETVEVTPGYLHGTGEYFSYYIPQPGGTWMLSSPDAHLAYVNESAARFPSGKVKALIRLLKAWKYLNDVQMSSFYLEMRAAQHAMGESAIVHLIDLCMVFEDLAARALPDMNDPKRVGGRFSACSSDPRRLEALSKIRTAATRARRAVDASARGDEVAAFEQLNLLFAGRFPKRW